MLIRPSFSVNPYIRSAPGWPRWPRPPPDENLGPVLRKRQQDLLTNDLGFVEVSGILPGMNLSLTGMNVSSTPRIYENGAQW